MYLSCESRKLWISYGVFLFAVHEKSNTVSFKKVQVFLFQLCDRNNSAKFVYKDSQVRNTIRIHVQGYYK